MKTLDRLILLVLSGVAVSLALTWPWGPPPAIPRPDTVFLEQAKDVAQRTRDTLRLYLPRWIDTSRVDTLRDTVRVPVRELVTVFQQCHECARKLDSAAVVIAAKNDTIQQLRVDLAAAAARCKKQRGIWAALGAGACVALRH